MTDRSVVVRLRANVADFKAQMDAAARSTKGVGEQTERTSRQASTNLGRLAQSAQENRAAWDTAGTALTAFGVGTTAALGGSVKAAIDWESAWAGVTKTVDGSTQQLDALEGSLRGMAQTMPATHGEIAAVAEAAGQLGVATEDVASFSQTMIQLGETTNLTADEAATSIAQMTNVMQTAPEDVDNLASALVQLGNNGASTERDIIQMSQRIAGAAAVVGMAESDVLAIANAVASMGIEVQAGGTSVSRVLTDMAKAASTGGEELELFAETAGMSAQDFATAFREDPAEAFASFIEGLAGVQAAGGDVFTVLDDLGLADVRVSQALLGMASSGDMLRESLDMGAEAWEANTALSDEYGKRLETTAAQMDIAKNNIRDAAISFGDVFLPAVGSASEAVADLAGWLSNLPEPAKRAAGQIGGVTAAAGLMGGAFLLGFPRIMDTVGAFRDLRRDAPRTASAVKGLTVAMAALAAIQVADAVVSAFRDSERSVSELENTMAGFRGTAQDVVDIFGDDGSGGVVFGEGWFDLDAQGRAEDMAVILERVAEPTKWQKLDDSVSSAVGSLLGSNIEQEFADPWMRTRDRMLEVDEVITGMAQTSLPAAQDQFATLWESFGGTDEVGQLMLETMPGFRDALLDAATAAGVTADEIDMLAFATGEWNIEGARAEAMARSNEAATARLTAQAEAYGVEATGAATATEELTDAQRRLAPVTEEAAQATKDALSAFIDWSEGVNDAEVSTKEWLAGLEEQMAAQADWAVNMAELTRRGVDEGVLAELERLGPEGAKRVADMVDMSDEELARFGVVGRASGEDFVTQLQEGIDAGEPPTATLDVDAEQAYMQLREWIIWGGEQSAFPGLGVVADPAYDELHGWLYEANTSTGTSDLDANDTPAQGELEGFLYDTNTSYGEVDMGANDWPAQRTRASLMAHIQNSYGEVGIGANTYSAYRSLGALIASVGSTFVNIGIGATTGRAGGGPIYGPGTSTSDSISAIGPGGSHWRLSNDEHIISAREVNGFGGHGAVAYMRALAREGKWAAARGFADGGTPAYARLQPMAPTPVVNVAAPGAASGGPTYVQLSPQAEAALLARPDTVVAIDGRELARATAKSHTGRRVIT